MVVSQGDESSSLYILLSGQIQVFMDDEQGRKLIINKLESGDYFGELALLGDTPRSANVMTTETCAIATVSKQEFLACLEHDSNIGRNIMLNLVERVQALTNDIGSLALQDVYSRLVRFIMEHSREVDGKRVTNKATHQEIADTIGSSREMISRILGDLKSGGYISNQGKQIVVEKKLPVAW